nr:hypothetical protein [Tanacetum cinerariifolium]
MPELEDVTYSDDEDNVGAKNDFNNLETSITVSPIPTTRVHKDHHVTQIIEFEDFSEDSINDVNAVGTLVPAVGQISPNSINTFSAASPSNAAASPTHGKSSFIDAS